jgi:3-carboxy-cis,cis-muconate cycloisomerase
MPAHIIDSRFLKDLYGTAEMRAVFDDMHLLQLWLDVEVALAQAQAELGIIPKDAAEEITRSARAEDLDSSRLKLLIDETVHPIVPLIRVLKDACQGEAGEYIHWGATTQDIMDTAMALQIKEAHAILTTRTGKLIAVLSRLAAEHRDTVMAGRTHGQQGPPVTLGFKAAVWLAEIHRHRQRLELVRPRVLVGQLGGAVGTLASLGEDALQVQAGMMQILGLDVPLITWHTSRDGLAEFTSILGMTAATAGKIAAEIINLQRTEIGEVEEPFTKGKVGSSTMPHKRNPMVCEAVLALTRMVIRTVPLSLDAMIQDHERDWTSDHLEWAYLGEVCIMTDAALELVTGVLDGLAVHTDRMRENLTLQGGLALSEAVMLALGKYLGRQTAHDIVYECSMRAFEEGQPFQQVLLGHPQVAARLSAEEVQALLDPSHYTGLSGQFVDRVLAEVNKRQQPLRTSNIETIQGDK